MNHHLIPLSTGAGTIIFDWGMSNILEHKSMKQGLFKVSCAIAAFATRAAMGEQTFALDLKIAAGTTGIFFVASAMRDFYLGIRSKEEPLAKHHYTKTVIKQAIAIPIFAGLLLSVISQEISKSTLLYGLGAVLSITALPILILGHRYNSLPDLKRGIELLGGAVPVLALGLWLDR